jgi:hypothetical protein
MKKLAIAAAVVVLGLAACSPPCVRPGPPSDCNCCAYHARYSIYRQGAASPWAESPEWLWATQDSQPPAQRGR